MASFIKEHNGLRWFDERYTSDLTNQSREQLRKKVAAGKLRSLPDGHGDPAWFAEPDVLALRDAYLKRKAAMTGRKPSLSQLEKRWAKPDKPDRPLQSEYVPPERRGDKKMLWRMLARPPLPESEKD